jgi:hypothetical protein
MYELLYRCLKKFTTNIRSSADASVDAGIGNCHTNDDYQQQQRQLLRKTSFFPREEANMPYDFKVRAWLDLLFAPVEMEAAAPGSRYFFPGITSDTESEEGQDEAGGSACDDSRLNPDEDEAAREQREWRACTRASIDRYRHEPEPKFRILMPQSLPSAWRENHLRQLRKVAKDLPEPRRQLDYSQQHQPNHQQLNSRSVAMPQNLIAVSAATAEDLPGSRQGLMQFGNGGVYYSTELNAPLKRSLFGSFGVTDTHSAGQQRKRSAYHGPMASTILDRIE